MEGRGFERLLAALLLAAALVVLVARAWPSPTRVGGELSDARPPAPAEDPADRQLLALERLPEGDAEALRHARQRWRAFGASHPPDSEYAAHARAALARLDERYAAIADEELERLEQEVWPLAARRDFAAAGARMDAFAARFAGTPAIEGLERLRQRVGKASAVEVLGEHRADFRHLTGQERNLSVKLTQMTLKAADQLASHSKLVKLVAAGKSHLTLGWELPQLPPGATLELLLAAGVYDNVVDCPIAVRINGQVLFDEWRPREVGGTLYRWPIRAYLVRGPNELTLRLHEKANTQVLVASVAVVRHK